MSLRVLAIALFFSGVLASQPFSCDLKDYKAQDGLKADLRNGVLELSWNGARGQQLRAAFTLRDGQPVVTELAARKAGAQWIVLGRNLSPEFEVTSGKRRLSEQQMAPLRQLGIQLTPEVIEREKWNAFWDAPLMVPGAPRTNLDLPRKPEEIRRAWATYHANACQVRTDGARIEVEFAGLELGIFSGRLRRPRNSRSHISTWRG